MKAKIHKSLKNKHMLLVMLSVFVVFFAVFFLSGCSNKTTEDNLWGQQNNNNTTTVESKVLSYSNNKATIDSTKDSFSSAGIKYGDSVDITVSASEQLSNVPFLSSHFENELGDCVVCGASGTFLYTKSPDIVNIFSTNDSIGVQIKLSDTQEYSKLETYIKTGYSDNIADYASIEEFANFREMNMGTLRPSTIYRGASPCDFGRRRCYVVDDLIEQVGVLNVLDLSENSEDLASDVSKFPNLGSYYLDLVNNNKIIFYKIGGSESAGKTNKNFAVDIINCLAGASGPVYIHCVEGKDRTGFAAEIIEMLAGANYDEIVDDYMLSYKNYYGITEEEDTNTYNAIKHNNLDSTIRNLLDLSSEQDLSQVDLKSSFTDFYLNNGGTQQQLERFRVKYTQN